MGLLNRIAARRAKRTEGSGRLEALGLRTLEAGGIRIGPDAPPNLERVRRKAAQLAHLVNPDLAAAAEAWRGTRESDGSTSDAGN